jgi:hypothetical protein
MIDIIFNDSKGLIKEFCFKETALKILCCYHLLMEFKKSCYIGGCKNSPNALKGNESRSGFFIYERS